MSYFGWSEALQVCVSRVDGQCVKWSQSGWSASLPQQCLRVKFCLFYIYIWGSPVIWNECGEAELNVNQEVHAHCWIESIWLHLELCQLNESTGTAILSLDYHGSSKLLLSPDDCFYSSIFFFWLNRKQTTQQVNCHLRFWTRPVVFSACGNTSILSRFWIVSSMISLGARSALEPSFPGDLNGQLSSRNCAAIWQSGAQNAWPTHQGTHQPPKEKKNHE